MKNSCEGKGGDAADLDGGWKEEGVKVSRQKKKKRRKRKKRRFALLDERRRRG